MEYRSIYPVLRQGRVAAEERLDRRDIRREPGPKALPDGRVEALLGLGVVLLGVPQRPAGQVEAVGDPVDADLRVRVHLLADLDQHAVPTERRRTSARASARTGPGRRTRSGGGRSSRSRRPRGSARSSPASRWGSTAMASANDSGSVPLVRRSLKCENARSTGIAEHDDDERVGHETSRPQGRERVVQVVRRRFAGDDGMTDAAG